MEDPTFDTPEEAAVADFPARYVKVKKVKHSWNRKRAKVTLLTNEEPYLYPYHVYCERDEAGRWYETHRTSSHQTSSFLMTRFARIGSPHSSTQMGRLTSRQANVQEARLWTLTENHRARAFYEKRGWSLTGRTRIVPFPPHPTDVEYARSPPRS